jgi:transaldolase
MNERIRQLRELGQSVWLDNLHRDMLESGQLARWIDSGVSGITSNPTIFDKAIRAHAGYQRDIADLAAHAARPAEIYDRLIRDDIRRAADLLHPAWAARVGCDGFVSLEVSPRLANDTERSIAEAERLVALVARENLFIKIPATPAGLPAIARLIDRGVAVNVTLIFSIKHWQGVCDAYLQGLEARAARGEPLNVPSVASFFVSRVDTAVDDRLPAGAPLRGRIAIANARVAYQRWIAQNRSPRWHALEAKGARPQRLLWGSSGTKNKAYSDVLYVEELAGPDTINTMPDATLEAFMDHGRVRPALTRAPEEAERFLRDLAATGIDLDAVCDELQRDGVRAFTESYDNMQAWLAEQATPQREHHP